MIYVYLLLLSIIILVVIYLVNQTGKIGDNLKTPFSCTTQVCNGNTPTTISTNNITESIQPHITPFKMMTLEQTTPSTRFEKPLLLIPVPNSFTPEKLNEMHNVKTVLVPLYITKVIGLNINLCDNEINSYINNKIFNELLLTPLQEKFKKMNIDFSVYKFCEEDGNKNIGTLLFDYDLGKPSKKSISRQKRYMLNFVLNNNIALSGSMKNNERIILRFLLLNLINETKIESKNGISIYFVPFLWGNTKVVILDRNVPDLQSYQNNFLPSKPLILVAEYTVESESKYVANIYKDSPYIKDTLLQLGECIGLLFGMDDYEFSNLDRLANNNIQYFRYNAFNNLVNGELLKNMRDNSKILPANIKYSRYKEYSDISLVVKQKLLCKNDIDSQCYQNLNLIKENIENYNQTEFLNKQIQTIQVPPLFTNDFYDSLDYSFI